MIFDLPESVYCYAFSLRKQRLLRHFIPHVKVKSLSRSQSLSGSATVLIWGAEPAASHWPSSTRIIRVEDGFLRSVGLGADLVRPVSWVFDSRGIYFDASSASDLEWLLENASVDNGLLERADSLVKKVIEHGLTKYNVGANSWQRPLPASRVILVPGQVETDASIRLAAIGVKTNLALLQEVRNTNPDAYVIYKPHPDVVAGLRAKGSQEHLCSNYCNEVLTDVPINELINKVDEVHVMTSLAGFEALLRGRKVVCYGMPFYAGWGLTHDMLICNRRTRERSLNELVACALILYPIYFSYEKSRATDPEQILGELVRLREKSRRSASKWRSMLRWSLRKIYSRP
jgi:capsular polysaccharide export protein